MSALPSPNSAPMSVAEAEAIISREGKYCRIYGDLEHIRTSKKPRRQEKKDFEQERNAKFVELHAELASMARPTPAELQIAHQIVSHVHEQKAKVFRDKMNVMKAHYLTVPSGWVLSFSFGWGLEETFFFATREEAENAHANASPVMGNVMPMGQYLNEKLGRNQRGW